MKRTLLTALTAILALPAMLAQNSELSGVVIDENGNGLEMANLLVLNQSDSTMLTYGFTDGKGQFRLRVPAAKVVILKITYLGYLPYEERFDLSYQSAENPLRIQLKPDSEVLNQVEVSEEMPIVISGDTISYRADAFATGEERKLEDVLKNLPGFEVDEDGQVKVEGKTVEKVMIEGQDVFDGDSKVATKNLPANAVDKVQVLRNYEEISPLQGLSSEDRIALNIKLKEGKKNLWFGDAEGKIGDPERYLLHGNAFYFNPKTSFNLIGDLNNVGKSAFTVRDYFRFSGGFRRLNSRSGLNVNFAPDDIPIPLGQNNRAEEVTSRFGAANFNHRFNKGLRISGFAIANENTVTSPYQTSRTYIGAATDSLSGQEELFNRNYQNNRVLLAKLSSTYEPNEKTYLNYDAFAKYSDQNGNQLLQSDFGDFSNDIVNAERQQPWSLEQNLEFFQNLGEDVIALEIQHLIKEQDPRLSLQATTNPFALIDFQDTNRFALWQQELLRSQSFDGRASYYWVLNGNHHLEFNLGGSRSEQAFQSQTEEGTEEEGVALEDDRWTNDFDFALQDLYGGLHYKTKWKGLTFRPGFNYHFYLIEEPVNGSATQNREFQLFLPDALLRYEFTKTQGIDLRYQLQAQFFDANQVVPGLLIQGYNSLFSGQANLDYAMQHSVNLNYRNFNLFNFTTIFVGAAYGRIDEAVVNQVFFLPGQSGLQQVFRPINAPGYNENLNTFGFFSRKFSWIKTDLRANIGYNTANNRVNGRENTNFTFNQNYALGFQTSFEKWPNLEVQYGLSINDYSGNQANQTFSNHAPQIGLTAPFAERWILRADYVYNNYGNTGSSMRTEFDFLNASVEYQASGSPWMFSLEGLNLLNTQIIREDGLSNNLISTTAYTVLPRYLLLGVRYDL